MTACFPPLVDTDYNKESSHGKINACGVKWKKLSDEGSCQRTGHPVTVIKKGDKKGRKLPFTVCKIIRLFGGAQDGIRFVCKGKDHIGAGCFHFTKTFNKGQAIKCVSAVDQKRHDGCCGKTQPFCENPYKGKLHGTGIDKETDEKGPAGSKTGLLEKEAKGNSKKNISQKNRDCFYQGFCTLI